MVGGDSAPPTAWFSPNGATPQTGAVTVTISWCDNQKLVASTRQVTLDGAPVSTANDGYAVGTYSGCGAYATSHVAVTLTAGASHTLAASISDGTNSGGGRVTYAPPIAVTVLSPTLYRDPSRCALDCGEQVSSYSTPAYTSQDAAKSLTFAYRSGRAWLHPMVVLDVSTVPATTDRIAVQLQTDAGASVPLFGGSPLVRRYAHGTTNRLAVQFDAVATTPSMGGQPADFARVYTAIVSAYQGATLLAQLPVSVRVPVDWLNGPASVYGAGWGPVGAPRYAWATSNGAAGGLVIMDGNGELGYWDTPTLSGGIYTYPSPPGDFSTVTYNTSTTQLTRQYPDGSTATFNSDGRTAKVSDALGNATTFGYASASWGTVLRSVTDPTGHGYTLKWRGEAGYSDNALWKLQTPYTITDGMGRTTYYGVDTASKSLSWVTDPDGQRAFLASYTGHALLTQWQDRRNAVSQYAYDEWGALSDAWAPAGAGAGGTARPHTVVSSWATALLVDQGATGKGSLSTPADSLPWSWPNVYVTDPTGAINFMKLDQWGAASYLALPGGVTTTAQRNANGNVTQTVDARKQVTTYVWDAAHPFLLDSVYDAASKVGTAFTYDAANFYGLQQTRVGGQEVEYRAYSNGRLASVRAGGTAQPATAYDYTGQAAGDPRPTKVTDPRGHVTTYAYESTGLQNTKSMTSPAGTTSVLHDAVGRDSVGTDPLSHTTSQTYDLLNRPARATDANSHTTTTAYDALYARTVTDAVGQVYQDSVSALGLPVLSWDPSKHSTATTYDTAGRVAKVTNRRGQTVTFGYDATLGFLASRAAAEDSNKTAVNATYGTDAIGHVRWAANAESVDSVWTDSLGRDTLAVHRLPALSAMRYLVHSRYDSLSRRTQVFTESSGPQAIGPTASNDVQYGFDHAAGVLDSLASGGMLTTLSYNADNVPTAVAWPNGVTVRDTVNAAHALTSRHYSTGSLDGVLGRAFSYDNGLRVTARFNSTQSVERQYTYDNAGQLTGMQDFAVQPGQCTSNYSNPTGTQIVGDGPMTTTCAPTSMSPLTALRSFQYDAVGNPSGAGFTVAPNTGNQLTVANGQQLNYDADGNMYWRVINGVGVQGLTWNSLGQLASVWNNPNQTTTGLTQMVTFGYDAWGRRVRKTNLNTGAITYFVWDGDNLAADADGTGRIVAQYAYYPGGLDQPHSVLVAPTAGGAATLYDYATELPGHVVGLVDGGGALAARYTYQPFGIADTVQESLAGGWTNRLRFEGREYDAETGLYYNRARYYDPALQRFLSPDPTGLQAGINWYTYAGNNPVNYRDPSGTCPTEELAPVTQDDGSVVYQCPGGDGNQTTLQGVTVTATATPPSLPPALPFIPSCLTCGSFSSPFGPGVGGPGGGPTIGPNYNPTPVTRPNPPFNPRCAVKAGLPVALDFAGVALTVLAPEASLGAAVAGSLIGVAGIATSTLSNDPLGSGLAYTSKVAGTFQWNYEVRGLATIASGLKNVSLITGGLSLVRDLAHFGNDYRACLSEP
ncbi:MAG TPA: RHS repeat-associated core domain-containing protein [Gemmatirosa sp.]